MGGVFITDYYQTQDPSGLEEQYGASEWSWHPERFNYTMDSSSVLPDTSERDGEETTTAMNGSASDDTASGVASILPWLWLQSLTDLENAWTDDSSESTSSKNESHWGTKETGSSDGSDLPAMDQDDNMELGNLAALPLWYNADFTFNYRDKRLDLDGDLLQADGITNAIIVLETIDSPGRYQSQRTRSTFTPNKDSSFNFRNEESISIYSESLPASSEATSEDEYPMVFLNRGNVIDMSKGVVKYMGKNSVDRLDEEGV